MKRTTDKLVIAAAAVCILCVVIVGVVAQSVVDNASDIARSQTDIAKSQARIERTILLIQESALGQCRRLQIERERSNVAEATIYVVLKTASTASPDPRARDAYAKQASATAYSPPANCARAVGDPKAYRPPRAIPFSMLPDSYPQRLIDAAKDQRRQPLP